MRAALARHDALLAEAVAAHGGIVLAEMGDGLAAAFASAHDAGAAALATQLALAREPWPAVTGPLRVRMGVHTDDAVVRDGRYVNVPLNRCARLMAAGHGGQLLVSGTAATLLRDALPAGAALVDLGEHRFRDLASPMRVFQMRHPELRRDFPPLRSTEAAPGNLPLDLSSFVGRRRTRGGSRAPSRTPASSR